MTPICLQPQLLKKIELFQNISHTSIEQLCLHGRMKAFVKGQHVFRDKDSCNCVYILFEGKASIYKTNDDGQKRVIFILDDGKLLNEFSKEAMTNSANCEIYEESMVFSIRKDDLLQIMREDFSLTCNFIDAISNKVRRTYRQLKNATQSIKVEKRVAAKLWKLCKDYGVPCTEGILIDIDINNTYLATLLGIQRETVSRSMKTLRNEGLIQYKNKRLLVPSPDNLSNYFKSL